MAKKPRQKLGGPYLAAAVFCENIVEDKDGALSCIRIIDTITVRLPADTPPDVPSDEKRIPVSIKGLVSFKRGGISGKFHKIKLAMESPDGRRGIMDERKLEMGTPPFGGGNLYFNVTIAIKKGGLFWMTVSLDGKEFTRSPLRILIEREASASKSGADRAPKAAKS
jgi:hypothetical protein